MKTLLRSCCYILLLVLFSFPIYSFVAHKHFMVLTDIHFNPFATCSPNQASCSLALQLKATDPSEWRTIFNADPNKTLTPYHQDSNYALFKTALKEARILKRKYHPTFILNAGDFLGHNFCEQYSSYTGDHSQQGCQLFINKTLTFMNNEFKYSFKNTPFYSAVGNNDSYTGDYSTKPNGSFFKDTAKIWSSLLLNQANRINFLTEFPRDGYYEITPPKDPNDRLIVINSNIFSPKDNLPNAAKHELKWLKRRLNQAARRNNKVWIMMHIPIGIDVYKTLSDKTIDPYWQPVYAKKFLVLLKRYQNQINGIFAGHAHVDTFFRIKEQRTIPMFVSPSISPIFGNNPAVKIYTYDTHHFKPNNYTIYELNLKNYFQTGEKKWHHEYNFNQAYLMHGTLQQSTIRLMHEKSFKDGRLAKKFVKYYDTSSKENSPIFQQYQPNYWCAIGNLTTEKYRKCVSTNKPQTL